MISLSQFWVVLSALAQILPTVIAAVREGRIKGEGQDEALRALAELHHARIERANQAGREWKPLDGRKSKWEV